MGVTIKLVFSVVISIVAIIIFVSMVKSGHWFKAMLTTSLSGFAALFAVNLVGMASNVIIPLNWYTIAVSGVLGAPGTILTLAVMATFLR
ncbi:MAG: hypothetical protein EOM05_02500 [Clostridia bacterium]|nr:hypothetical protein [Clostridia bacterium]